MQWLQDPNQSNIDNFHNVRREASRHFRNKKKAYLKTKMEELETNSKIKNIADLYRGINEFKKGYRPRTAIVKDEMGVWLYNATVFWLGGGAFFSAIKCILG